MSLINEALKKAQRVRHEHQPEMSASGGTHGGAIARRGKTRSANTMVLLGAGAVVLIVLSVVVTVYLVNRPTKPAGRVAAASSQEKSSPSSGSGSETSAPIAVTPALTVPKTTVSTEPSTP